MPQRLKNFLASASLATLAVLFYAKVPYFQDHAGLNHQVGHSTWRTKDILLYLYYVYVGSLALFYLFEPYTGVSKSVCCWRALCKLLTAPMKTLRTGLTRDERLGLLTVMVKAFFAPMMVVFLAEHMARLFTNGAGLYSAMSTAETSVLAMFNAHGFWFALQAILLVDVAFFTIGYLVELPALKNEIRSVDPTLLGWLVALMCYPPLNDVVSSILGWRAEDFPQFDNPVVHVAMNMAILVLMGVYAAASASLNFKASNLTHRGIVSWGPYRFVRHPAYVCKNMAWWIGAIPTLSAALAVSALDGVMVAVSVIGWSVVYYLRAVTEEDHLRSVDGEYADYCQRVRFRFIPWVY
ncbi:MAG: DUF1295 domain-containing protein [Sedimenticolaceae bacterium]